MYRIGAPIKVVRDDLGAVVSLEFVKMDERLGLYCSPADSNQNYELGVPTPSVCSLRLENMQFERPRSLLNQSENESSDDDMSSTTVPKHVRFTSPLVTNEYEHPKHWSSKGRKRRHPRLSGPHFLPSALHFLSIQVPSTLDEFEDGYHLTELMRAPKGYFRRQGRGSVVRSSTSAEVSSSHSMHLRATSLPSLYKQNLGHAVSTTVPSPFARTQLSMDELEASMRSRFGVPEALLAPEEDFLGRALASGFSPSEQTQLCEEWAQGSLLVYAAKYKSVEKKVRPVNAAMPQHLNPPLRRPPMSRDPYATPLTPRPPCFTPTSKVTEERLEMMNFGGEHWLSEEERKLMLHVVVLREKAIAFCEAERGCLKHSYGLPYVIPVVDHEPWQQRPIPIPRAKKDEFTSIVRERLRNGLYEQSSSSYSSPVFCVIKSDSRLRIVHDLQNLNKVTIKDAGMPPAPDEFVESFMGRACYGLGDIMGGYDERELAHESRPLTTFETPLGRFQLTRLPQGATNSVAVYQTQMMWILQDEIPEHVGVFIDDGGIKGPRSRYNNAVLEENPGIRRFIWEYAIILERVLFRIEESGLTVSAKKFAVCVPSLDIVGHVVSYEGRSISKKKMNKILTWPQPTTVTDIRAFLGICVYVRIFICLFAEIASPLRRLTRKDVEWDWNSSCQESFEILKQKVGEDICLKGIDYSEGAGDLKLAVDSSSVAAGAVLMQVDEEGRDRPILYESLTFTPTESRYSQPKLELCGVAKILKKLQTILWGQHFELQVDALSLVQMIQSPSLPNAPMTRWVAFIQLFDFTLVHKPGKTFTMPDGLSRRLSTPDDEDWTPPVAFDDMTDPVNAVDDEQEPTELAINFCSIFGPMRHPEGHEEAPYFWNQYGHWQDMLEFLTTHECPDGLEKEAYRALRRKSARFYLHHDRLMRRASPVGQIVVSCPDGQKTLLSRMHEELGHQGVEETYRRLVLRFWWPNLKRDVREWVQSCEQCQRRDPTLPKEPGAATGENTVFGRVSMDAVHIKAGRYKYLIVARDDLSGWVEAEALVKLDSRSVTRFFNEHWIQRYGVCRRVTVDGGPEFQGDLIDGLEHCGIKRDTITPYYPEAHGMIE